MQTALYSICSVRMAMCLIVGVVIMSVFTGTVALAANGSVLYTYDALGRIATATYDTGVIVIYTYDSNGNRLSQTINVNTTTGTWGSFSWGTGLW